MIFLLTARTHALFEKRKGLKENVGLDFSISFENWLNLWKYKHWKLVEAQLQTWCALYSAFCVCVFLYFLSSCCLFIFPVFSVVGFPFHPQFFSPMLHLLFLAFYTRDFVTYIFETPPFFLHKSAFHPYENVRSSFMGHILNQLYFTSAWLLVTLVTLSKTVNPLAEKPLSSVV